LFHFAEEGMRFGEDGSTEIATLTAGKRAQNATITTTTARDRWIKCQRNTRLQVLAGKSLSRWITKRGYVSGRLCQLDKSRCSTATLETHGKQG
jgi:hypothetical protein